MIALSHAFILIAQKAHKIRQDIYLPDLPLFVTPSSVLSLHSIVSRRAVLSIAQCTHAATSISVMHRQSLLSPLIRFLAQKLAKRVKGKVSQKVFFFHRSCWTWHSDETGCSDIKTTQNSHLWFSLSILAQNVEPFLCDTLPLRDPCQSFKMSTPVTWMTLCKSAATLTAW